MSCCHLHAILMKIHLIQNPKLYFKHDFLSKWPMGQERQKIKLYGMVINIYILFGIHQAPLNHHTQTTYTLDSRYIAVIYNTIVHTTQQSQWYNFGQTLHSGTTPHTSPLWASYGVSFVSCFKEKLTQYIESALYSGRQMMDDRQWAPSTWNHIIDQSFGYGGYIHHKQLAKFRHTSKQIEEWTELLLLLSLIQTLLILTEYCQHTAMLVHSSKLLNHKRHPISHGQAMGIYCEHCNYN